MMTGNPLMAVEAAAGEQRGEEDRANLAVEQGEYWGEGAHANPALLHNDLPTLPLDPPQLLVPLLVPRAGSHLTQFRSSQEVQVANQSSQETLSKDRDSFLWDQMQAFIAQPTIPSPKTLLHWAPRTN